MVALFNYISNSILKLHYKINKWYEGLPLIPMIGCCVFAVVASSVANHYQDQGILLLQILDSVVTVMAVSIGVGSIENLYAWYREKDSNS